MQKYASINAIIMMLVAGQLAKRAVLLLSSMDAIERRELKRTLEIKRTCDQ